jgi:hypothetical protein
MFLTRFAVVMLVSVAAAFVAASQPNGWMYSIGFVLGYSLLMLDKLLEKWHAARQRPARKPAMDCEIYLRVTADGNLRMEAGWPDRPEKVVITCHGDRAQDTVADLFRSAEQSRISMERRPAPRPEVSHDL